MFSKPVSIIIVLTIIALGLSALGTSKFWDGYPECRTSFVGCSSATPRSHMPPYRVTRTPAPTPTMPTVPTKGSTPTAIPYPYP